jgi:alpha-aminoadipate carrier protein LysW
VATKPAAKSVAVDCPDCGEKITLRGPISVGQRVTCPECDADLEVIGTDPVELDWVYEDSDYEDEDED